MTTQNIFTQRRMREAIKNLSRPLLGGVELEQNPEWTDQQITEAYQQIAPLYGKRCIVNLPERCGEPFPAEGILCPAYISIQFLYSPGPMPISQYFSIEDLELTTRDPLPTFNVNDDLYLRAEFPLYGLEALEARVKLYFAGVRKSK